MEIHLNMKHTLFALFFAMGCTYGPGVFAQTSSKMSCQSLAPALQHGVGGSSAFLNALKSNDLSGVIRELSPAHAAQFERMRVSQDILINALEQYVHDMDVARLMMQECSR